MILRLRGGNSNTLSYPLESDIMIVSKGRRKGTAFLICMDVAGLVASGKEHEFYVSGAWRKLRADVLKMDRCECQRCKAMGRYRKAVVVHHVAHLKDRPDLALSVVGDDGHTRQLVSLCKACHEAMHPEIFARGAGVVVEKVVSAERWD